MAVIAAETCRYNTVNKLHHNIAVHFVAHFCITDILQFDIPLFSPVIQLISKTISTALFTVIFTTTCFDPKGLLSD
jgi:hypothetical protein